MEEMLFRCSCVPGSLFSIRDLTKEVSIPCGGNSGYKGPETLEDLSWV